jgi:hypothetical protein
MPAAADHNGQVWCFVATCIIRCIGLWYFDIFWTIYCAHHFSGVNHISLPIANTCISCSPIHSCTNRLQTRVHGPIWSHYVSFNILFFWCFLFSAHDRHISLALRINWDLIEMEGPEAGFRIICFAVMNSGAA